MTTRQAAWQAEQRAAGLCEICGNEPLSTGRVGELCRQKRNAQRAEKREQERKLYPLLPRLPRLPREPKPKKPKKERAARMAKAERLPAGAVDLRPWLDSEATIQGELPKLDAWRQRQAGDLDAMLAELRRRGKPVLLREVAEQTGMGVWRARLLLRMLQDWGAAETVRGGIEREMPLHVGAVRVDRKHRGAVAGWVLTQAGHGLDGARVRELLGEVMDE